MILLRAYPKITDFIYEVFGRSHAMDYRFLPVYSFGFFVALAFVAAAWVGIIQLKRREKLGLLKGREKEIIIGEAPATGEIIFYFLFGFVVFFKLIGFISYHEELSTYTLQLGDYIKSIHYGSIPGGIIGGGLMAFYYYYTSNKAKLPQPVKKKTMVYPSDGMGDLVVMGAVLGVLGSSLFNFLEDPTSYQNFWSNPIGSLFSGLSIYGGLICATIGFMVYAYIRKINILYFFDALAPGVILANGIGRLGCQVAGDGDWGIINLHNKPAWIPEFLWSSHYEHNIADMDGSNILPGCDLVHDHCNFLTYPVYPTPIYEFLMCGAIFLFLWAVSKRLTYKPGMVLILFMALISIERFSIEKLRDLSGRELYHIFGMALRQSELISILIFIGAVAGGAYLYFVKYKQQPIPKG